MTHATMRLRLAGVAGGLGAAIGVLIFGETTPQLLLSSTGGFLVGAAVGFVLAARVKANRTVARADGLLRVGVLARIAIA